MPFNLYKTVPQKKPFFPAVKDKRYKKFQSQSLSKGFKNSS
jgi:hypothetical protein